MSVSLWPEGITFDTTNDDWHVAAWRNKQYPLPIRLHHLARLRSNASGHAEFRQGELAMELGLSGDAVASGIRRAVAWGLLEPGSSMRCLVLNQAYWRRGGNIAKTCGWHGPGKYGRKRRKPRKDYTPKVRDLKSKPSPPPDPWDHLEKLDSDE